MDWVLSVIILVVVLALFARLEAYRLANDPEERWFSPSIKFYMQGVLVILGYILLIPTALCDWSTRIIKKKK